jgi:DNA processing protein
MTTRRDQAALLLALRTSGRPWSEVAGRVEDARSALAVLDALLTPDQPTLEHADVDHSAQLDEVEREIESWAAEGIRLVTLLDHDYPVRLKHPCTRSENQVQGCRRSKPVSAPRHRG